MNYVECHIKKNFFWRRSQSRYQFITNLNTVKERLSRICLLINTMEEFSTFGSFQSFDYFQLSIQNFKRRTVVVRSYFFYEKKLFFTVPQNNN